MLPADPPRGVIRGRRRDTTTRLPIDAARVRPPDVLAGQVHHFWLVRWTAPFTAEALAHPAVRIIFDDQAGVRTARLEGPPTGKLTRAIASFGQTFGISFRPGAFTLPSGLAVATLTDRVLPLEQVLGPAALAWQSQVFAEARLEDKVRLSTQFLAHLAPELTPDGERARDLAERIRVDRQILRVEDLCRASGSSPRTLQRLFRQFVGVSPKRCIRRFRLLEAVELLATPKPPSLAHLAGALGYADQAHLTRDFTRTVGQSPRHFARHAFD